MWSQKSKARARTKRYLHILTGLQKNPSPLVGTETLEEQKDHQVKKTEFEQGNSVGYNELMSTVFDDISFALWMKLSQMIYLMETYTWLGRD